MLRQGVTSTDMITLVVIVTSLGFVVLAETGPGRISRREGHLLRSVGLGRN